MAWLKFLVQILVILRDLQRRQKDDVGRFAADL